MKKKTGIILAVVLAVVLLAAGLTSAYGDSLFLQMGEYLGEAQNGGSLEVAAAYKDQKVMMREVEYQRNMWRLKNSGAAVPTDREIVNRLIEGMILLEVAEEKGLTATQAEVDAMMENTRAAYDLPDGKKTIDEYCAGAGMTVEEYYEKLERDLPDAITRQKLKDEFGREYCEEHGLEFTKVNQPPEINEAYQEYRAQLLKEHLDDIVYYID